MNLVHRIESTHTIAGSNRASSAIWRDPIVRLAILAMAMVLAPYFLPGLSLETRATWAVFFTDPILVLTCLGAFRFRLHRLTDPAERRFWNLWTLAMTAWLTKSLLAFWLDYLEIWTIESDLLLNTCYFLFYSFAAIALETRPQVASSRPARLAQTTERVGTLVYFFGLALYFAVIPAILDPAAYESSALLLFVALDFYLVVRLTALRRDAADPVWKRVYTWLLVTACLWWVTDTAEMLMWAEVLPWAEDGQIFDLLWYPSYLTLIISARVRELPSAKTASQPPAGFQLGSLVWFSVSFPVIHFSLTRLGFAAPTIAPTRETLALVLLMIIATMVVIHSRFMRTEYQRLERERQRTREKVEHLAFHDELTGLPNRRLLADRANQTLSRARRYNWHLAILVIDIDDFKEVNDTLGHDAGDSILRQLAERLRRSLRENDTIARVGGDEFVAVIEGLSNEAAAHHTADFLSATLDAPYRIDDQKVEVTASVGCAIFPRQGDTFESLLREADAAMYREKSREIELPTELANSA
jgi:diguanylate cyclase (GGDEF)-like protein